MSRLYKVLNKKDCAEMGIQYRITERIVLAEHNTGHYTITRYASFIGKMCIVLLSPSILLWHIGRGLYTGIRDCACVLHDTFQMCYRREIWGDDNKYISYLKENY